MEVNKIGLFFEKIINFSSDKHLINEIYDLSIPSYRKSKALLERDVNRCNEIYILKNNEGRLLAFFMVNFEKIGNKNAYFLGWSACHDDYKNAGYGKYLYNSFFLDCKSKEEILGERIPCFWTTATPIAYYWFNKNIENCQPDLDGNALDEAKELFIKIVDEKYPNLIIDMSIPFILRGVAIDTNYSDAEQIRLKKIENGLNIKAFFRYPINEINGDRYLMLGYAPALETIQQRLYKINHLVIKNS